MEIKGHLQTEVHYCVMLADSSIAGHSGVWRVCHKSVPRFPSSACCVERIPKSTWVDFFLPK